MAAPNIDKKDESGTVDHAEMAFKDEKRIDGLDAIDPSNLDYSGAVINLDPIEKALVKKLDLRIMVSAYC